ncbi:MAG: hypothetical protein ACKVU0_04770 [Saprospiraceae bacterium]
MKQYKKIFGIFRNPAVFKEMEALDPHKDHQRMVHLGLCYEFPFDMVRANELALFATYASVSISSLLDRTGEFSKHGQKRYDDTRFLITKFAEDGYDGPFGQRAIAQMNKIHGNFRIPNEDFIFVLSTLIFYPMDWMEKYGWRRMLDKEKQALFLFYSALRGVPWQSTMLRNTRFLHAAPGSFDPVPLRRVLKQLYNTLNGL